MEKEVEYQITKEDLDRCIKFAVEYHLDKTKLSSNRTTGQYRGLGGIIDSFVIGKLIEIGVAKIIERSSEKVCRLDFDIHELNKENISDPDIISVSQNEGEKAPNLFIEIKNISEADRWIGLTTEQFKTILSNKSVAGDAKKVVLIYATLVKKSSDGDVDPLGVYLKSKIDMGMLEKFCNVGDLFVRIKYIITGEDLKKYGVNFDQGSNLYETEIIKEASSYTEKRILEGHKDYKKMKLRGSKLPIIMSNLMPEPKEFGRFEFKGDIDIYVKTNYKNGKVSSRRMYIQCKKDTVIKNNVLGVFGLEKGKIYECWFTTVGMNPSLKRNNIWIAQRNLGNIVPHDLKERIDSIGVQI